MKIFIPVSKLMLELERTPSGPQAAVYKYAVRWPLVLAEVPVTKELAGWEEMDEMVRAQPRSEMHGLYATGKGRDFDRAISREISREARGEYVTAEELPAILTSRTHDPESAARYYRKAFLSGDTDRNCTYCVRMLRVRERIGVRDLQTAIRLASKGSDVDMEEVYASLGTVSLDVDTDWLCQETRNLYLFCRDRIRDGYFPIRVDISYGGTGMWDESGRQAYMAAARFLIMGERESFREYAAMGAGTGQMLDVVIGRHWVAEGEVERMSAAEFVKIVVRRFELHGPPKSRGGVNFYDRRGVKL